MTTARKETLERLGFSFELGGAHLARSMMLKDLRELLRCVPDPGATRPDFARAITQDNCLGKRSLRTRTITLRHLTDLYALDPTVALYRAMRHLWQRDPEGQPLLACLLAYARDPILRLSAPFIARMLQGEKLVRKDLEEFLEGRCPGRFTPATLMSLSQNVVTTWAHAGHLAGGTKKTRSLAIPTPGAATFALLLGYAEGVRGLLLLETEYAQLLGCPPEKVIDLAEEASRRGWLVCKHLGAVFEVRFPYLLTPEEQGWIHEQG